jgi:hypothetical protein
MWQVIQEAHHQRFKLIFLFRCKRESHEDEGRFLTLVPDKIKSIYNLIFICCLHIT